MSVLEFVIQLLNVLAWPITVLLVLAIFRKAVAAQIERLISLRTPGGLEMKFVERKVQDIVRRLPQVLPQRQHRTRPPPDIARTDELLKSLPGSPSFKLGAR